MLKNKFLFKLFLSFSLVVLLTFVLGIFVVLSLDPVNNNDGTIYFKVENGDTLTDIVDKLDDNNLISNVFISNMYAKLVDLEVKTGLYQVDSKMSTTELLNYLSDDANAITDEVSVTLIEGDWLKDIALKISNKTNVNFEELIDYWNNEEEIRLLMDDYPFLTEDIFNDDLRFILEGYLHPNTYNFFVDTTPNEITRKLLDGTLDLYDKYKGAISNSGYSIHEIFTLSSIIQAEAAKVTDMELISGVLYNRLNRDMLLQVSVSICYAVDMGYDEDWTVCELNSDVESPFNTYIHSGLTPGPIKSFGESALNAALNPIDSEYLYFVADVYGTGEVFYSETLEQHNNYVEEFGLNF